MATYTSTQDGDWNNVATWGGGGTPDTNSDVVSIGHKVKYNLGVSALVFGNVTVNAGGILYFPVDADWKLTLGATALLNLTSGSEIRTGTASDPAAMGISYLGQLHFAQSATNRNVVTASDGCSINMWGNPDFYGGERYAQLNADWTSGQTLYVKGDYSSKWKAGQRFWIHVNTNTYPSNGYQSQGKIYQIDSVSAYDAENDRTGITIVEGAPGLTFTALNSVHEWQSILVNISRNLELSDPGASFASYGYGSYTERNQFTISQTAANDKLLFKDCLFSGFKYALNSGFNVRGENLSFVNNEYGLNNGTSFNITADFISNYGALYAGTAHQITGMIGTCYVGLYTGSRHRLNLVIISCNTGIQNGDLIKLDLELVLNNVGVTTVTNADMRATFRGNVTALTSCVDPLTVAGDILGNTTTVASSGRYRIIGGRIFSNTALATTIINTGNTVRYVFYEDCTFDGTFWRPWTLFHWLGDILTRFPGEIEYQSPPSGNNYILQVTPNTYSSQGVFVARKLSLGFLNDMALVLPAGQVTLSFSVYPLVWSALLTQDDVALEVKYLNSASGMGRTQLFSTSQTYANDGWRTVSVTFTPARAGLCYFNLHFGKFESGASILVDPVWSLT